MQRILAKFFPGILLCLAVTGVANLLQVLEVRFFGHPYVEALVLAILIGVIVRTIWKPGPRWVSGINFSAKFLLEFAVVLLGASLSTHAVLALGPLLLLGIAGVVVIAIVASYAICRGVGLSQKMAILVACGNSICGNSAIAAVAPVIGADGEDIASSIAFTAVLGVVVVLGLPLLVPMLHLSLTQYGVLAGLTVYAVPQVLAATLPIGAISNQVGTIVKLVRVLMLGPVVLCLSLVAARLRASPDGASSEQRKSGEAAKARLSFQEVVPWFILAFLAVAILRSLSLIPQDALKPIAVSASLLTTISMAALGLGVDVRIVARAGFRVTIAVTASLAVLGVISFLLIRMIGVQ